LGNTSAALERLWYFRFVLPEMMPEQATPLLRERFGIWVGSLYPPGGQAFFRRWVGCTVAGQVAGFTVAAALAATQDVARMSEYALVLGAGALEGALVGRGQAIAMTRLQLPSGILRLWPVATAIAAVVAWSIGLIPNSVHRIALPAGVAWPLAAIFALGLLLAIPAVQFLLLRTVLPTASRWIRFNAVAWLLGITWTFVPSSLIATHTPVVSQIGIYAIAGGLMATTVAMVTGLCWLSWLKSGNLQPADASNLEWAPTSGGI
jgi:hypothetical protein